MVDSEKEEQQTELQRALAKHFLMENYNTFITLTFKGEAVTSYAHAQKAFGRFMHSLRCKLFKERSRYRMPLLAVVEGYPGRPMCTGPLQMPHERTHIHCCIRLPDGKSDYRELVRHCWLDADASSGDPLIIDPAGDKWFIDIPDAVSMERYVHYSLKQCRCDHEPVLWNFARRIPTA